MKKYQVKKYFDWGSLKFEPLEYLDVNQAAIEEPECNNDIRFPLTN